MQNILVLFRKDLRLQDNPAYYDACSKGNVLLVYIFDDLAYQEHKMGAASKVWLHHSLESLQKELEGHLVFAKGDPKSILLDLIVKHKITSVFVNESFEPWYREFDKEIEKTLEEKKVNFTAFRGSYLRNPEEVIKQDGKPFSVFTPFKKKSYTLVVRKPLPKPEKQRWIKSFLNTIEDLDLLAKHPWVNNIKKHWEFGEKAAQKKLDTFLKIGLEGYKQGRDFPCKPHTSLLSPYLAHGEISPYQIWHKVVNATASGKDKEHFLSELTWREFSYYLLYYFPQLPDKNFQRKFDRFPWKTNSAWLRAWQKGETGYPIVDAGMRQLWETGYMHNRVRMIVGSFLTKNLLISWKEGRSFFWDCLVDADIANNSASWQWIAGSGADAAPYFRIFSPRSQVEKFDSEGEYIRKFVPVLKDLDQKYLAQPWLASESDLRKAGIVLGENYPHPIVDPKESRQKALDAFQTLSQK